MNLLVLQDYTDFEQEGHGERQGKFIYFFYLFITYYGWLFFQKKEWFKDSFFDFFFLTFELSFHWLL